MNGNGTTQVAHSGLSGLPFWLVVGLMAAGAVFIFRHRKHYKENLLALALPMSAELFFLFRLWNKPLVFVAAVVLLVLGVANMRKRMKASAKAARTTWKAGATSPSVTVPSAEPGETATAE